MEVTEVQQNIADGINPSDKNGILLDFYGILMAFKSFNGKIIRRPEWIKRSDQDTQHWKQQFLHHFGVTEMHRSELRVDFRSVDSHGEHLQHSANHDSGTARCEQTSQAAPTRN